jgi:hypothetical protein
MALHTSPCNSQYVADIVVRKPAYCTCGARPAEASPSSPRTDHATGETR